MVPSSVCPKGERETERDGSWTQSYTPTGQLLCTSQQRWAHLCRWHNCCQVPPSQCYISDSANGVLVSIKCQYRGKILKELILQDDSGTSIIDVLKGIHILKVSVMIAASWNEITEKTVRLSWRKILPLCRQWWPWRVPARTLVFLQLILKSRNTRSTFKAMTVKENQNERQMQ